MPTLALRAHYNGQHIVLDEDYNLEPNTPLMVTILPFQPVDQERTSWSQFSCAGLANAYGDDEPEYTSADLRP
jgi:hypothetical protein